MFTRHITRLVHKNFIQSLTSRTMSTTAPPAPSSQDISATAKAEGGPTKGSQSAHLQSQLGKEQNFERTAQEVGQKMQTHPESITSEVSLSTTRSRKLTNNIIQDASHLKSREARAIGQSQPPKDSISSDAQRLASANEQGTGKPVESTGSLSSDEQSHLAKERNFQSAADQISDKIANHPEQVTKDDADLLHSREQRAHGHTDKGGIAAQAQHLASENAAKTAV